mgnify:FL=1
MSKIALYLSSRNNYDMIENVFLENVDLEGYKLYNIDDYSEPDEVKKGMEICERNNITFIKNKDRGLQWAAKTMIDYLDENDEDVDFIVWCTHDTFPLTKNFFSKFDKLVSSQQLNEFGMIGFNIFGPQCGVGSPGDFTNECGILGRAPISKLSGRGGWFRVPDMKLSWDVWGKPCLVDAPVDMLLAMNVKLFKEHIEVSNNYHLFCAHDDIALQFLYQNICNVTLPDFRVWHNQHLKEIVDIPVKSASAAKKGDSKHFGDYGPHLEFWKDRWGFTRDDRSELENIKENYAGTLIYDLYHHDYSNGPLKQFKIKLDL